MHKTPLNPSIRIHLQSKKNNANCIEIKKTLQKTRIYMKSIRMILFSTIIFTTMSIMSSDASSEKGYDHDGVPSVRVLDPTSFPTERDADVTVTVLVENMFGDGRDFDFPVTLSPRKKNMDNTPYNFDRRTSLTLSSNVKKAAQQVILEYHNRAICRID